MSETEMRLNEAVNQIARGQVEILDKMDTMVKAAVKETVNGRLDPSSPTFALKEIYGFMQETREHMDETKEIMEAFRGVKAVGEIIKWVSSVGIALAAIWVLIRSNFKI